MRHTAAKTFMTSYIKFGNPHWVMNVNQAEPILQYSYLIRFTLICIVPK